MKKILLLILFCICPLLYAAEDYYQFTEATKAQQFQQLTTQLRCLVCQNQNIAESNSALAQDLRDKIYQKIQANQSNQQIIDYLVARYGDFILYKPPFNKMTLLLWLTPFVFLGIGISYLILIIRRKNDDFII